jgi:2-deoxy-D-gluconate 3-dehydrogenase
MTTRSITQLFDLTGKAAIITGGAMGIGRGIALRLAEAGAAVLIADTNLAAAHATVEEIKATGGRAEAIQADASSAADAHKVVERSISSFGRLDILVNNAGIYPFVPALETTEETWDRVLAINLKGVFLYTQIAARQMVKAGQGGRIINIASIDALHPTGNLASYDASKGGVLMLTRAFAQELGRHNITVNAIAPGGIETPGAQASLTSDTDMGPFIARIPLGRQGTPDDVAKVALFLASGAADYITGDLIVVDGGYLVG